MTHEEIIMQLSNVIAEQKKQITTLESTKAYYSAKCAELEAKIKEAEYGK